MVMIRGGSWDVICEITVRKAYQVYENALVSILCVVVIDFTYGGLAIKQSGAKEIQSTVRSME